MALDDDIRVLAGIALFEGFGQEQLRLLAFGAENISVASGRLIYAEGDSADCAFVVTSGTVKLVHGTGDAAIELQSLGTNALLGELALIADSSRPTSAVAATNVELIRLNRRLFRRILEEYPQLAALLHDRITAELQDLIARITQMAGRFAD
jgi:CRP-like cAMP-binding protein